MEAKFQEAIAVFFDSNRGTTLVNYNSASQPTLTEQMMLKQEVKDKDFILAIGLHKFRGTSKLCRSSKSIFSQIAQNLARKNLHQTGSRSVLTNVLIRTKFKGLFFKVLIDFFVLNYNCFYFCVE